MKRAKTQSFVVEFPLRTTEEDERCLGIRLEAARQIYNATLGEALLRLGKMRSCSDYQQLRSLPVGRERTSQFRELSEQFGFSAGSLQKYAEGCRDACWIGQHLGSHDTQSTSLRAFMAVEQYSYGKRGRPRFKGKRGLHSIEGKSNQAVIRYRNGAIEYFGLALPLLLDRRDKDGYQKAALSCKTKYCRIVRRVFRGRDRYFVQLVQEGAPPQKARHTRGNGVVGLDIGPSTLAAVSETTAFLVPFCPNVPTRDRELRTLSRAMDRSRRATNPENYTNDGQVKSKVNRWKKSKRYIRLASLRAELYRRLASERKKEHGELANRILAAGNQIKTEKLSYKSFQKNFGRSVGKKAPSLLVSLVRRKAESAGGRLDEFSTKKTKLSQFDHSTGEYKKKPLAQRTHVFGDNSLKPVQRDLYSAFLAKSVVGDELDISQVNTTWPGAEPLLRRAMSSEPKAPSGKRKQPHGKKHTVGGARLSKGSGLRVEDRENLPASRERFELGSPRIPRL